MLILISPAKTLDYQSPLATPRYTQPELLDHSQQLIQQARQLSAPQISRLMGISDKLADLNATRFHDWQPHFTPDNARQAMFILAYRRKRSTTRILILLNNICACSLACMAYCARWI